MILENTSGRESVAFKVKTTRPDRYHVKPTVGMIGPKKKIRIRFVIRSEEVARIVASRFASQNDVDPATAAFCWQVRGRRPRWAERTAAKAVVATALGRDSGLLEPAGRLLHPDPGLPHRRHSAARGDAIEPG